MAPRALSWVAALASLTACALVFWRINTFPAVGFDEWWFLARAERLVTYGDPSDVVGFDLFAENGRQSKLPPLGFPLRSALHLAAGRGVGLARLISAGEMVVVGTLLGWLARRMGAPPALGLLGPALLLTSPTVFLFARTVRYEQDIFFFGALSLLLPSLAPDRRAAWIASGLLSGAAATMHPMGSIFPIAIGLAALCEWRRSGLVAIRRPALSWLGALVVPAALTAGYYAADWTNTLAHIEGTRLFHEIHHPYRVRALRAMGPLPSWVPEAPAATLNALWHGLRPLAPAGLAGRITQALWAFLLIVVAAASVFAMASWLRRPSFAPRWVPALWAGAVVSALLVTFAYAPNTDYVLYLSALGCMALFLGGVRRAAAAPTQALAVLSAGMAALVALDLAVAYRSVAARSPDRPTAAAEVAALREVGRRLGIGDRDVTYADTVSWAAAGRRLAPVHEYAILEVAPLRAAYAGLVLSARWYEPFVTSIAPFSGEPIDPAGRQRRMESLVLPLSFAGCAWSRDAAGGLIDTRLFLLRQAPPAPLFAIVQAGLGVRFFAGEPLAPRPVPVGDGPFSRRLSLDLPGGRYAAMLTGAGISESRLTARIGEEAISGSSMRFFPHAIAGALVGFEAPGGEVALLADGVSDGEARASLLIWRLSVRP